MGEYIYLDKNQKEETSLLMATQTQHSSMKPAKKMQSYQSVCNESDEQIRE